MMNKLEFNRTWGREPWAVREVTGGTLSRTVKDLCIFDADNALVTIVQTVKLSEDFGKRDIANTERIVNCVNWCKQ